MTRFFGVLTVVAATLLAPPVFGQTISLFPVPDEAEVLKIDAATDIYALQPLIADFQKLYPRTSVKVTEYVTTDLFQGAQAGCRDGKALGDVYLSSAVDQLVKLANDGCAVRITGENLARAPHWANWRDEVVGFTYEPIVFIYNRDLVPPEDVPRTHVELAELLRRKAETYVGKVGTYDIRLSGIGYLLAFNDSRQTASTYGRLLESLGRANVVLRCCSSTIIDEVSYGRLLIGYNMLASYAVERVRQGYPLRIVMPSDYTLVLSRGAMIPAHTQHPEAANRFIDYLLSERGQRIAGSEAFFFGSDQPVPEGVEGPDVITSGIARPIAVGPTLLVVQDAARRKKFLQDWENSVIQNQR